MPACALLGPLCPPALAAPPCPWPPARLGAAPAPTARPAATPKPLLPSAAAAARFDVIDACAAPGNKTTHAAMLLAQACGGGRVFACERDPKRAQVRVGRGGARRRRHAHGSGRLWRASACGGGNGAVWRAVVGSGRRTRHTCTRARRDSHPPDLRHSLPLPRAFGVASCCADAWSRLAPARRCRSSRATCSSWTRSRRSTAACVAATACHACTHRWARCTRVDGHGLAQSAARQCADTAIAPRDSSLARTCQLRFAPHADRTHPPPSRAQVRCALVDPSCSGSGMVRPDHAAVSVLPNAGRTSSSCLPRLAPRSAIDAIAMVAALSCGRAARAGPRGRRRVAGTSGVAVAVPRARDLAHAAAAPPHPAHLLDMLRAREGGGACAAPGSMLR